MRIVDFAYQVIEMDRTIRWQAQEIERLREFEQMYRAELDNSLRHGREMMCNVLRLALTPGVMEACEAAKDA
jgi:hypothetical protein